MSKKLRSKLMNNHYKNTIDTVSKFESYKGKKEE